MARMAMVAIYLELTCRLANRDFTIIGSASCAMPVEVDVVPVIKVAATRVMIPIARRFVGNGYPSNALPIQCFTFGLAHIRARRALPS